MQVSWPHASRFDMLHAAVADKVKDLSNFNKGQIVIASRLGQLVSETVWPAGGVGIQL